MTCPRNELPAADRPRHWDGDGKLCRECFPETHPRALDPATLDDLMLEDQPFDASDPRRGGWARVEVGRTEYYAFVREVQLFGLVRCEILVPHADGRRVLLRKSYRGRDVFTIEPSTRAHCLELAPREVGS